MTHCPPGECPDACEVYFAQLTPEQRGWAVALGYDAGSWDEDKEAVA